MSSQILYAPGTARVFKSSGGDTLFTPTSVAAGAGRVSTQWDRGAGSLCPIYRWQARTRIQATAVVGEVVNIYLVFAQDTTTMMPGKLGVTDAAVASENLLLNAKLIGQIIADVASTTVDFVATDVVRDVRSRYVSVAWFNKSAFALSATAGDHEFILLPVSDEAQ